MPKPSVMTKSNQMDERQAPMQQSIPEPNRSSVVQESIITSPNAAFHGAVEHYTGQDCIALQNAGIRRVRELQDSNDQLQRHIKQINKEVDHSNDPLTLLAEKERCEIMVARNMGEILQIHKDNEARLARIAELEAQNIQLKEEAISQRDNFIGSHDLNSRYEHATEFFLAKSHIERNIKELFDLNQE